MYSDVRVEFGTAKSRPDQSSFPEFSFPVDGIKEVCDRKVTPCIKKFMNTPPYGPID